MYQVQLRPDTTGNKPHRQNTSGEVQPWADRPEKPAGHEESREGGREGRELPCPKIKPCPHPAEPGASRRSPRGGGEKTMETNQNQPTATQPRGRGETQLRGGAASPPPPSLRDALPSGTHHRAAAWAAPPPGCTHSHFVVPLGQMRRCLSGREARATASPRHSKRGSGAQLLREEGEVR